jgi:uncharacterized membrane protein (Fun14 family)
MPGICPALSLGLLMTRGAQTLPPLCLIELIFTLTSSAAFSDFISSIVAFFLLYQCNAVALGIAPKKVIREAAIVVGMFTLGKFDSNIPSLLSLGTITTQYAGYRTFLLLDLWVPQNQDTLGVLFSIGLFIIGVYFLMVEYPILSLGASIGSILAPTILYYDRLREGRVTPPEFKEITSSTLSPSSSGAGSKKKET